MPACETWNGTPQPSDLTRALQQPLAHNKKPRHHFITHANIEQHYKQYKHTFCHDCALCPEANSNDMDSRLTNTTLHPDLAAHSVAMEDRRLQPQDIQLPPSPPFEGREDALEIRPAKFLRPDRPETPRRATSPDPIPTITTSIVSLLPPPHPRPKSPGTKHLRSTSSSSSIGSQPLQRAHSSPGVDSTGRFMPIPLGNQRRPASPLGHHGRRRSPLRTMDDSYPASPSWSNLSLEPNIPENAELELDFGVQPSLSYASNTFPRSRRRPTSPLHASASAPVLYHRAVSPASGSTSPSLAAQRYANEPYPGYSFSSASSMPSTPTSLRSRSPSISSLETIEDTPEAEEAAIQEAEEMAKLRADEHDGAADMRRRSSLDLRSGGLRSNKERKRWSVCGAERRADFSLEPIEE